MNLHQSFKTLLSHVSRRPSRIVVKPVSLPDQYTNSEAASIVNKVSELLDKLPEGGTIEIEDETIAEIDPQTAVKLHMPQVGAEAMANKNQKFSKKIKLKVKKL